MAEIIEGETTDPQLGALHDLIRRGQQRWNEGQGEGIPQHDQMTIFGPFGGQIRVVTGDNDPRQAAVRAQFRGGDSTVAIVRTIRSGDLAIVVSLSTNSVQFAGRTEPHPWVLRVTEVYQQAGDSWSRLHRHADPLIKPRPLTETLELLAD